MELKDILRADNIRCEVAAGDKLDVLRKMCDLLAGNGLVGDAEVFLKDVIEREKLGPTCIGNGVAIPHGKSAQAKEPTVAIFKLAHGVTWEGVMGDEEASVVILFCVSDDLKAAQEHLRLLAEVARKLAHEEALDALRNAATPQQVIDALL